MGQEVTQWTFWSLQGQGAGRWHQTLARSFDEDEVVKDILYRYANGYVVLSVAPTLVHLKLEYPGGARLHFQWRRA